MRIFFRRREEALRKLQRMQEHILLLIKIAPERVAGFLLEMAERIKSTTEVELQCRGRTSHYLGLTGETVSRMLVILETARPSRCQARAGSCFVARQRCAGRTANCEE
jgi:CRP-like cAMP-binding protein